MKYELLREAEDNLTAGTYEWAAVLDEMTNTVVALSVMEDDGKTYIYRPGSLVRVKPEYCEKGGEECVYTITNLNEETMRCYIAYQGAELTIGSEELVGINMIIPA